MSKDNFEEWAIVELFGHQRMAGKVSNAEIGGCAFVRVDVPATNDTEAATRFLGNGAIYALNIVTEQVARAAAVGIQYEPVARWDMPELNQLPLAGNEKDSPF